jgi:16S rRNA (cytosine1402-N4)-methyltransferase
MPVLRHIPVLWEETLRLLAPQTGEVWVDCTTGACGHAKGLLAAIGPEGRLLALDQDLGMVQAARETLNAPNADMVHANFDQLAEVLQQRNIPAVDGVLADLGFSSDQMDNPARGFSFQRDGPLDMRLDPSRGVTASELVNTLSEEALADTIYEYGEDRMSRRIARAIVAKRTIKPFATTTELAEVVRGCLPRGGGIDPATRTFQALRIAVNDELGALDRLLAVLPQIVKPGGRVGIISFHSLEDRRVKQAFRTEMWEAVTKKPVVASDAETATNPRARSAKLRVARRRNPDG